MAPQFECDKEGKTPTAKCDSDVVLVEVDSRPLNCASPLLSIPSQRLQHLTWIITDFPSDQEHRGLKFNMQAFLQKQEEDKAGRVSLFFPPHFCLVSVELLINSKPVQYQEILHTHQLK